MTEKPKQWPMSANTPQARLDHNGKRLPSTAWLPGQTGNAAGRPREGESWSGTIKTLSAMTSEELADLIGSDSKLGKLYSEMPKGVPIKRLVVLSALAALVRDPTPGLLDALASRAEGRIPLSLNVARIELTPEEIRKRVEMIFSDAQERLLDDESADLIE